MNRREFLKKGTKYIFTGALFIPSIGIWRPSEAFWHGQTLAGGVASWSAWEGKDQVGWGDADNVNIVQFDDPDANDDETSVGGGLTGADLVFTEAGGIVGSATDGSGYTYRQLTEADDTFSTTDTYWDLFTGNDFTQIIKLGDIENHHAGTADYVTAATDSAAEGFAMEIDVNDKLNMIVGGANHLTTDSIVTTGNIWFCIWRRAAGNVKAGFCTSGSGVHGQPTVEGDFDANKMVDTAKDSPVAGNWTINSFFTWAGGQGITAKAYYAIAAKVCLIGA